MQRPCNLLWGTLQRNEATCPPKTHTGALENVCAQKPKLETTQVSPPALDALCHIRVTECTQQGSLTTDVPSNMQEPHTQKNRIAQMGWQDSPELTGSSRVSETVFEVRTPPASLCGQLCPSAGHSAMYQKVCILIQVMIALVNFFTC